MVTGQPRDDPRPASSNDYLPAECWLSTRSRSPRTCAQDAEQEFKNGRTTSPSSPTSFMATHQLMAAEGEPCLDAEQEQHDHAATSSSSSTSPMATHTFPTSTPSDVGRPGAYVLRQHIETSASNASSGNNSETARAQPLLRNGPATQVVFDAGNVTMNPPPMLEGDLNTNAVIGCAIPPPPIYTIEDLQDRVLDLLGQLWDRGEELMAQKLAQEILKYAMIYKYHPQGDVLSRPFDTDDFEIGDIVTCRWEQWLAVLMADVTRTATYMPPDTDGFNGRRGGRSPPRRPGDRSRSEERQKAEGPSRP